MDQCEEHKAQSKAQRIHQKPQPEPHHEPGPEPSCLSCTSDQSNHFLIDFKEDHQRLAQQSSDGPSGQSTQQHQTQLDSIFMLLEDNTVTFVKTELKKFQKVLSPDYPESQEEDEVVPEGEDAEQRRISRDAFVKITLHFLRRMKQEELADRLQSKLFTSGCERKLKCGLKKKFLL